MFFVLCNNKHHFVILTSDFSKQSNPSKILFFQKQKNQSIFRLTKKHAYFHSHPQGKNAEILYVSCFFIWYTPFPCKQIHLLDFFAFKQYANRQAVLKTKEGTAMPFPSLPENFGSIFQKFKKSSCYSKMVLFSMAFSSFNRATAVLLSQISPFITISTACFNGILYTDKNSSWSKCCLVVCKSVAAHI